MNLLELAMKQLRAENKEHTMLSILEYGYRIRKWIDKHPKASLMILQGKEFKTAQEKHYYSKI